MNDNCTYVTPDITQSAASSIIYTVNWPTRGLPAGATISSAIFTPAEPTDYTISNISIVENATMVSFELSGGIPGTYYAINNQITLSDGEVMNAALIYKCVFLETRQANTCI